MRRALLFRNDTVLFAYVKKKRGFFKLGLLRTYGNNSYY